MTTTGVVFRPQSPPEELRAAVEAAEEAGVDELWLWEDCFLEGGLTTAAAALAWSSRVTVGIGLLPVPFRNPALAAMELATLARLFPGRLVALGHGVQDWMRQVGAAVDSPMTLLREHTTAVRALLARRDRRRARPLRQPRPGRARLAAAAPPTLLIGARGPKSVALAGELADGVLLDTVIDPAVVRRAREAGRRPGRRGLHADRPAPRPGVRGWIAELAAAGADAVDPPGHRRATGPHAPDRGPGQVRPRSRPPRECLRAANC